MVRAETKGRVAHIELARLDKKNAITTEMYVQMAEALAAADADPKVRAVLLHGSRDCFTAGNDLSDFLKRPPGTKSPSWSFFETLPALQKPIVAALRKLGMPTTRSARSCARRASRMSAASAEVSAMAA